MKQIEEKKLLYYNRYEKMPRHYDGAPIYHVFFIDVKTGKEFALGLCDFAVEVSNMLGGRYYSDITKAAHDYDILWNISDEKISPITNTFEEVQLEYQRLLREGIVSEEINSKMIALFQEKQKQKTLKK